jgi:hypothetical protein
MIQLFNLDRQTHRQTDTHPSIHIHTGKFLMPLFDTFHFTMFVKDKATQNKALMANNLPEQERIVFLNYLFPNVDK